VVMSRDQNAGQNNNIKVGRKSLKSVEHFTRIGTTITNQNSMYGEIKSRLKSGNSCYRLLQNLSVFYCPRNSCYRLLQNLSVFYCPRIRRQGIQNYNFACLMWI
jgi:hypothetical protein